jgi:hypothetical protein
MLRQKECKENGGCNVRVWYMRRQVFQVLRRPAITIELTQLNQHHVGGEKHNGQCLCESGKDVKRSKEGNAPASRAQEVRQVQVLKPHIAVTDHNNAFSC